MIEVEVPFSLVLGFALVLTVITIELCKGKNLKRKIFEVTGANQNGLTAIRVQKRQRKMECYLSEIKRLKQRLEKSTRLNKSMWSVIQQLNQTVKEQECVINQQEQLQSLTATLLAKIS